MNKLYTLTIALFIIIGFYSCKKDADTTSNFNKYIVGKWAVSEYVDTTYKNDTVLYTSTIHFSTDTMSSGFTFNTDKTGAGESSGVFYEKFRYQISNSDLLFSNIQQFSPGGSPISIDSDHDSSHIFKLTDREMVLKEGTSPSAPSSPFRAVIYVHYIKL